MTDAHVLAFIITALYEHKEIIPLMKPGNNFNDKFITIHAELNNCYYKFCHTNHH